MRYVVWFLAVMCQIGNLVCLNLITKKENTYLKAKINLPVISIILQLIAVVALCYLIFFN